MSLYIDNCLSNDFYQVSDFNKIISIIAEKCNSEIGKSLTKNIVISTDANILNEQSISLNEVFNLFKETNYPPNVYINDFSSEICQLKTKGWVITVETLYNLLKLLTCFKESKAFFCKNQKSLEVIKLINSVEYNELLLKQIIEIIDENAQIKDTASPKLLELRKEYKQIQKSIDKLLNSILTNLKSSGLIEDNVKLTIRNSRSVIPILVQYKYKIKGIIHDESATGQTVYIEPIEIVELNNKLKDNENSQLREIKAILANISDKIHFQVDNILQYFSILGYLDFISAKVKFALQYNCIVPFVENLQIIDWKEARNLILQINLENKNSKIVPLNIKLDNNSRLIVISGANAGGKSVVLKTIALTQLMVQCGIPVPISENSRVGVFSYLHLNIGDGQSLETSLSTYTSHLVKINSLLEVANNKTLYLLDELGTGTDPVLGGALAQAVLMELHKTGAYGIVTTHLDSIKLMVDEIEFAKNAAMLFDTNKLNPTFELKLGLPGNSFTFEIAKRTGISEKIIQQAKKIAGDDRIKFENKISDIYAKSIEVEEQIIKNKVAEDFLNELIAKYSKLLKEIQDLQNDLLKKSKIEAEQLLILANKTIENTISQIKKSSANKEVTKSERQNIKDVQTQISNFQSEVKLPIVHQKKIKDLNLDKKNIKQEPKTFNIGQKVKYSNSNTIGIVSKILNYNQLLVNFDNVAIIVNKNNLQLAENQKQTFKNTTKFKSDLIELTNNFSKNLDLRGLKAEEVESIIDKHIDEALLLGIYNFSILHGKGWGILRKTVRIILEKNSFVDSFEHEHIERGGDGITIVNLKK